MRKKSFCRFMVTLFLLFLVGTTAFASPLVKQGMQGESVRAVQKLLIAQGFLSGPADGICGKQTVAAIERFQKAKGLPADGICGAQTYAKLDPEGKIKTPAGRTVYVSATGYSAYDPGNSMHTSTGALLRRGIIAVDPSFIALGTKVFIPGYGEAVAADVGWGIRGNVIDVAFDTHQEALFFGRQNLEITILQVP